MFDELENEISEMFNEYMNTELTQEEINSLLNK